ncbi:MAG: ABC transporter permease [Steroidobacteraceae bacterium]
MTAVRGLLRHKLYSFINVAGLSIGLAAAILIILYVRDQLSYDGWIPGTSHVYRLERGTQMPGHGMLHGAQAPFPVVQVVGEQAPGLKAFTHVEPELLTVHGGYPLTVTGLLRAVPHNTPLIATGAAALLIAWATVSTITLRLARTNPVHALRYE